MIRSSAHKQRAPKPDLRELADRVRYKGWYLCTVEDEPSGTRTIWWQFLAYCAVTGFPAYQNGRKWDVTGLSDDATIKTAFLAAKVAEEHELLELFKVDGVAIFDPHLSIGQLKGLGRGPA